MANPQRSRVVFLAASAHHRSFYITALILLLCFASLSKAMMNNMGGGPNLGGNPAGPGGLGGGNPGLGGPGLGGPGGYGPGNNMGPGGPGGLGGPGGIGGPGGPGGFGNGPNGPGGPGGPFNPNGPGPGQESSSSSDNTDSNGSGNTDEPSGTGSGTNSGSSGSTSSSSSSASSAAVSSEIGLPLPLGLGGLLGGGVVPGSDGAVVDCVGRQLEGGCDDPLWEKFMQEHCQHVCGPRTCVDIDPDCKFYKARNANLCNAASPHNDIANCQHTCGLCMLPGAAAAAPIMSFPAAGLLGMLGKK